MARSFDLAKLGRTIFKTDGFDDPSNDELRLISPKQAKKLIGDDFIHHEVITSDTTWTKPTGLPDNAIIRIEAWGGGGGGGMRNNSNGGSGGGGGAYKCYHFRYKDFPSSVDIVVGEGGAGATADGVSGTMGGYTAIGDFMIAAGGFGGAAGDTTAGAGDLTTTVPGTIPPIPVSIGYGNGMFTNNVAVRYASTAFSEGGGGGGSLSSYAGDAIGGGGGGGSLVSYHGGVSIHGGNGGRGSTGVGGPAEDGHIPGGGGGGSRAANGPAGKGARGEVRIWIR